MEKLIIKGGKKLYGKVLVSGAKNVALKAIVAACLTEEEVIIKNIPLISDFYVMVDIIRELGGSVDIGGHTATIKVEKFKTHKIYLDKAAEIRTSLMLLVPLLLRAGKAVIPNPGGCRIGARPIDRIIDGLRKMGVDIRYNSNDGYFYAKAEKISGVEYKFEKSTHTGTETLILAAVLAKGKTVLENCAQEPEIDDLINFLNKMGAKVKRISQRTIVIQGVQKLHGTEFTVSPDRNEVVTLAIAALLTQGDIYIKGVGKNGLLEFLEKIKDIGGGVEETKEGIRFFSQGLLKSTDVTSSPYPGFMTDWQSPWAVLMTKAQGLSTIHEAVYENRFGYVEELRKMGANIEFYQPKVEHPETFYNFNISDDKKEYNHGIKILGPAELHNGVVTVSDLRAGATLVLAALSAKGESTIYGIEHLDRGYEKLDQRLKNLGADIKRIKV
ncbi:MAG: UDP-N-acetylglucosamine 1-carboxyvinyltransferase [Candidatus Levybacteria bacterium]|nr:UDP-N-acetylglucosamine 1-carboxyvinyltransferase [Candidatus Levybacteria bacterium]